jgi:hypothetical protein
MAVSDARMPRAIAVPRSGWRRWIAAVIWAGSSVGTWIEKPVSLNATTPIRTVGGWCWTKASAAALAASIRVGARSVAAMLFDTSNARIAVPSTRGTLTTACGRAIAKTTSVSPSTRQAAGPRRRHRAAADDRFAADPAGPAPPPSPASRVSIP